MKKVLKGIVAFSVLLTAAFVPVSALASDCCSPAPTCATATPACPDPCAKPSMKCPETIYFANDSACDKHLKITYRSKCLLGMVFKRTLHITLAGGEVYAFTYDNARTWSKKVTVKDYHLSESHKIQSEQLWFTSELVKRHGMPYGATPKARTGF